MLESVASVVSETPTHSNWPPFPKEALFTGWLGQVTDIVTAGTTLPKSLADSYQRVILGTLLDGHISWEGTTPLHTRVWNMNVAVPGSGKGELWRRLASSGIWADSSSGGVAGVYSDLLEQCEIMDGLGSGESIITTLKDSLSHRAIVHYDEGSTLFAKDSKRGSILLSTLRTAFDEPKLENRTVARKKETVYVRMGFTADIQPAVFDGLVGTGNLQEGGFLRRIVFANHNVTGVDDLPEPSEAQIKLMAELVGKIAERLKSLKPFGHDIPPGQVFTSAAPYKQAFKPCVSPEAKVLYGAFKKELQAEKDDPTVSGLLEFLKRDALIRTVMSDTQIVSAEIMAQSISWIRYQWAIRKQAWRETLVDKASVMEQAIYATFDRHGEHFGKKYGVPSGMSATELYKYGNLIRKGGSFHFGSTLSALHALRLIRVVATIPSHAGNPPVQVYAKNVH